jgi:hypothetical protein
MLCSKCGAQMETVKTLPDVGMVLRQRRCTRRRCGHPMVTQEIEAREVLFRRLKAQREKQRRDRLKAPPP